MAVPKGRHSHARSAKRAANWKLEAPALSVCPRCKHTKLPHHICENCGYYDGRQVVADETKAKKAK